MITKGTLYVVATPLGNLSDISNRAIEVLNTVDLILCEDTRHFLKLATNFNIQSRVKSYHDHNERYISDDLVELLKGGQTMALVSDAGTPTISDPGYGIVRACRKNNIPVMTVPGPSSITAAISISGLPADNFYFVGFLPQKSGQRQKKLQELIDLNLTTIFLESPYRILKVCEELSLIAPTREFFLARELTKIYEEGLFGTTFEVFEKLKKYPTIKGEFVGIISKEF